MRAASGRRVETKASGHARRYLYPVVPAKLLTNILSGVKYGGEKRNAQSQGYTKVTQTMFETNRTGLSRAESAVWLYGEGKGGTEEQLV